MSNVISSGFRRSVTTAIATLLCFGGCLAASEPDTPDEVASVEQFTFLGDLGVRLGSPVTTNNTTGLTNDYTPTCSSSSVAPDASYTWTAPSSGSYVFSTAGSSFDTVLGIRQYTTGASLGCNDDSNGTLQSAVTTSLSAGQTVLIVVDGYGSGSGPFQLNIVGSGGGGAIPATGLHLWLRADAGIVPGTGAQIFQWLDQSGNGRNARMATVARQPSLVSGALNGRPVVRFFGAQSISLDIYTQPTTFSVFIAGKNSLANESYSMILGPGGNSPNNQLRWDNGSQALFVTQNAATIRTSPIGNTRVYHALSARYDGSTMTFYRDGTAMSSSTFSTTVPWTIASIGSWYSSYFMVGDLAEVILYDRALSEAERNSVNSYLRAKYGLP
jgi:hypothetical protein